MKELFGIALSFFLGWPSILLGATLSSSDDGNWTAASTWFPNATPASGDTMVIQAGHEVTINSNLSYTGAPMRVDVYGTWRFNGGGAKISMPPNSVVYIHAGGSVISTGPGSSGNSQTISIGGTVYWNGGENPTVSGPSGWPYGALPVELIDFTVSASFDMVTARWATASEFNSAYFELRRSRDLENWDVVDAVDAAGFSTQVRHYVLEERAVPSGTWYYRLIQVDLDGSYTAYMMAPVTVSSGPSRLVCTADPVREDIIHVHGDWDGSGPVLLVNASTGRITQASVEHATSEAMWVRVTGLAPGVHVLRMGGQDGQERSCRFLIAR